MTLSESDAASARFVRAAAESTLATHGACAYTATVKDDGAGGWTEPWSWQIGVADPARRAVRLKSFDTNDSPVIKFAKAAAKRWPWMGDEGPTGEGPHPGGETIDIGRRHFYGTPGGWSDWTDLRGYGPARPLWILEAIVATVTARAVGRSDVRGESCARYLAEVQPGQIAGREGIELIDPPHPGDDWAKLAADVSVDPAGLIRRVLWSPTTGTRFRPGLIPRLAKRFEGGLQTNELPDGDARRWTVLELWDYGSQVEIDEPTNLIETGETSIRDIARDIWRRRRDYKRRQLS